MKMVSVKGTGARNTARRFRWFSRCLAIATLACATVVSTEAQLKPETDQFFHRLFASEEFEAKTFGPARWLEGGESYTTVEGSTGIAGGKDIVRYVTATGERSVLVAASQLVPSGAKAPLAIEDYAWSTNMERLLLYTNSKRVWRQNTRGDYWVLERKSDVLRKLGGDAPASSLMFAKFSPDGSKAAYVRGNNIYVEDLASGSMLQLTHDGSDTTINGISDWVYEEELFLRDSFRWSPDSKRIAYWQFDTRGVGIFPLIYNLGAPKEIVTGFPYPGLGRYPSRLDIPYPITGTQNSAVRVGVVNATGGDTRWLNVPGDPRENYIARMEWAGNANELVIEQINRLQNASEALLANADTGEVHRIFRDQDAAWVDCMYSLRWIRQGSQLLWLSERDGWRHVYGIPRDGSQPALITRGAFDVISIDGVDEKGGFLYFIASPENATQQYLYRMRLDGSGEAERLSPAGASGTHAYDISPDGRWGFHTFSNVDTAPTSDLVELPSHKSTRVLADNQALRATAAPLIADTPLNFFRLDIGDGVTLDGWMVEPPHFDPAKKYPVLVFVYGEPAAQTVVDEWGAWNFFFNRAVAREGYVVVSFDNRGTPAPKGRAWRKVVYGAIHPVVVKDQTAAIQALLRKDAYLDGSRVGLWGWSGGGSSTLNLMFHGYAIAQRLQQVSRDVVQVPQGSLYPALHRLENRGLLAAKWEETETGREAKFYQLTPKGRAQLETEAASWQRLTEAVGLVLKLSEGGPE